MSERDTDEKGGVEGKWTIEDNKVWGGGGEGVSVRLLGWGEG